MKVLFIDPPYAVFTGYSERYFCPGMALLAAILREAGHECLIFEADTLRRSDDLDFVNEYARLQAYIDALNDPDHWIWDETAKLIQDFRPDLVGIHAITMKFGGTVRVAELVNRIDPSIPVLVGGPHATDWPQMALKSPAIDFTLRGEADDSIVPFVSALEAGTGEFDEIPGLLYRKDGGVVMGPPPRLPQDISRHPLPARDLLLNQDGYTSEDMGVILTSRGCPYDCTFCSHERLVRYRTLDDVIDEMKLCIDTYGTTQFTFKDDSFTVKRDRTREFCQRLIDERLDINWECTTRVNLLSDELLEIMMRSGFNVVKVGIESGSERILSTISKKATFDQMRKAADSFNRMDLFWTGYFMYGLPTETFEDMKATYRFMKELDPHYAGLGLYAPYPGTPLWDEGVTLGLVDPDVELEHFFTTNPKDYFMADPKKRTVVMEHEEFEEAADWMMQRFNEHNTQLATLLRRGWIRRKSYLRDLDLFLKDCGKALRWKGWLPKTAKEKSPLRMAS